MGKYKLEETELTEKDLKTVSVGKVILIITITLLLIIGLGAIGLGAYAVIQDMNDTSNTITGNIEIENSTDARVKFERTVKDITIEIKSSYACDLKLYYYHVNEDDKPFLRKYEPIELTDDELIVTMTFDCDKDSDYKILLK